VLIIPPEALDSLLKLIQSTFPPMGLLITILIAPAAPELILHSEQPLSRSLLSALASALKEGLCELTLGQNCIGDEFIQALSQSSARKTLTHFTSSACSITDASSAAWGLLTSLSHVSLRGCDLIGYAALDAISSLPQLADIFFGSRLLSSYDVIYSILRSRTVRRITVLLNHDDESSIPKIWDLFRSWEARDLLQSFNTGDSRGYLISEELVKDFQLICPNAKLEGLVWSPESAKEWKFESDKPEEEDAPAPSLTLAEALESSQRSKTLFFSSQAPQTLTETIYASPGLTAIDLRLPSGFKTALDRANFFKSISSAKEISNLLYQSTGEHSLSASEVSAVLASFPKLKRFSATVSCKVSELSISHSNLEALPTFGMSGPIAPIRWLPSVRGFFLYAGSAIPAATALPGLATLNIERIDDADAETLGKLAGQLRQLTVSDNLKCWPKNAPRFCKLGTISLFRMNLDYASLETMIESCPLLRELTIQNRNPFDRRAEPTWHIESLNWLRHKRLRDIAISFCVVTQEDYKFELDPTTLPSVTSFDLQWTKGVQRISVHDMPHLSYLSIQRVSSPQQIIHIERCPELAAINLLAEEGSEPSELVVDGNPNLNHFGNYGYSLDYAEENGKCKIQQLRRLPSRMPPDEPIESQEDLNLSE
jgi:hypothetical protein